MQLSADVRNAMLDAIAQKIGAATMKVWPGPMPARCALSDEGEPLASFALPQQWMTRAVDGSVSKSGEWKDWSANNSGKPGYFRIYSADGRCRIQGVVGKDMRLNAVHLIAGQMFTVTNFTIRDGNG